MKAFEKGDVVISVGNEWMPMIIGPILDFPLQSKSGSSQIPLIEDWVGEKQVVSFGFLIPLSYEAFWSLIKLNPYERFNLLCIAKNGFPMIKEGKQRMEPNYNMKALDYLDKWYPKYQAYMKERKKPEEVFCHGFSEPVRPGD
jgi:hypothetical protein